MISPSPVPFGPWRPDAAALNAPLCVKARNCLPAPNGFKPLRRPAAGTAALVGTCYGAAVTFDDVGAVHTFAGDDTRLYKLGATTLWNDVSYAGGYTTGGSERWQFGSSGNLVIAVTASAAPQKFLLNSSTTFQPLGGMPPNARYIATLGEFVVLGGLQGAERKIWWSGIANAESWTAGSQSSDFQVFQNGGSVRGLIGGEVAYVFQAQNVTRMTFVPGSAGIMQFDQVEGGRGLAAPYSLLKFGGLAYYLSPDGFYSFSLASGQSTPLGVGKWAQAFRDDLKSGQEYTVLGSVDPIGRFLVWAYNSADNANVGLNRWLIYDWTIDEATTADISTTALAQMLSTGFTMDTIDSFGSLDSLPFSLDSAFWRGGSSLLGNFAPGGTDSLVDDFGAVILDDNNQGVTPGGPQGDVMETLSGTPLAATFVTGDAGQVRRTMIQGFRPHIDTRSVTISASAREAEGDTVTFNAAEAMEDNGTVPAWCSGFVARAQIVTGDGVAWSKITGVDAVTGQAGAR
jgi:hypothetical protein